MRNLSHCVFLCLMAIAFGVAAGEPELASDWPGWRGPTHDGVAAAGQTPAMKWSESENVLWASPVPGRGQGSPIVVGERVFVTAAEPEREVQSVLCFDRGTGK